MTTNSVYDFSAYEHSVMLGDHVRLDAYLQAIQNQIKSGMSVVEVGTGMGILSAFAAAQTTGSVYAIEFKTAFAELSRKMFKAAGLSQVQVIQAKSFDVDLPTDPDILVTETIGALGPEEHIVEICYDFKKRHPKVLGMIPARLRIFAEPIRSARIRNSEKVFLDYFSSASFGTFQFDEIFPELLRSRSNHFLFDSLSDAKTLAPRTMLVEYILGETQSPGFESELTLPDALAGDQGADAYHLYFEADLDQKTLLTTHYSKPETHWGNAYVRKPVDLKKLKVSYTPSTPALVVSWS